MALIHRRSLAASIKPVYLPKMTLALCHLVVVSCVSQQASKGDSVGNAAQVDEKHSGDRLNVETFIEITG